MDYFDNMHTGDIVISANGNIGYVTHIDRNNRVFSWSKVYDRSGNTVPFQLKNVPASNIPALFKRIGCQDIYTDSSTFNTAENSIDKKLYVLNNNLLTLIEKLDKIIKERTNLSKEI